MPVQIISIFSVGFIARRRVVFTWKTIVDDAHSRAFEEEQSYSHAPKEKTAIEREKERKEERASKQARIWAWALRQRCHKTYLNVHKLLCVIRTNRNEHFIISKSNVIYCTTAFVLFGLVWFGSVRMWIYVLSIEYWKMCNFYVFVSFVNVAVLFSLPLTYTRCPSPRWRLLFFSLLHCRHCTVHIAKHWNFSE